MAVRALGVREEETGFRRPPSVDESRSVSVALSFDPFVARRRLFRADARTTTLLDADEQKHSRPVSGGAVD